MSIFDKIWNWWSSQKIQNQISCQKIHTIIWNWLWRYFCTDYMIWFSQNFTSTCHQIWMNYSHDEHSKHLSKFEIRQENLYENFRENESSIWLNLQIIEEFIWIKTVSKSVKQEDHQNIKIFRIWTDFHWC